MERFFRIVVHDRFLSIVKSSFPVTNSRKVPKTFIIVEKYKRKSPHAAGVQGFGAIGRLLMNIAPVQITSSFFVTAAPFTFTW